MNAPTNFQVIHGPDGKPEYVVIPYAQYIAERHAEKQRDPETIPNDVVGRTVDGATPVKAWREHLGFTQTQVAAKLGITQGAYAQQEASDKLRRSTREKIAAALGIFPQQLDF
ncbi:helix-turn-helix domain-containing protein [Ralstonia pseudosolanacearum]